MNPVALAYGLLGAVWTAAVVIVIRDRFRKDQ